MKAIQTIQPTPEQVEKIYDLFNSIDPEFPGNAGEDLLQIGQALFRDVGRLKNGFLNGGAFIQGGTIGDGFIFDECYLVPIKDEGIFVRLDFDNRDDEDVEVEIFVHKLEDLERVRDFLVHELSVTHLNQIAGLLKGYGAPDAAMEKLRRAIQSSKMGAEFMADEAARTIQDAIEKPAMRRAAIKREI